MYFQRPRKPLVQCTIFPPSFSLGARTAFLQGGHDNGWIQENHDEG